MQDNTTNNTENNIPRLTFEDFKNENGISFWWASDMAQMLGYSDSKQFLKVLDKTTKALLNLNINHYDNIIPFNRDINGTIQQDFKLTRFACYIATMNSDPKRVQVAQAQSYFAHQTRQFELYLQDNNELDRLLTREELAQGNTSLNKTASSAGGAFFNYAYFQNAGYRGMYNMFNTELAAQRGIPKEQLMDHMGRNELAANLFRVTQTEARIKSQGIRGQKDLENAHFNVGAEVRELVIKNSNHPPEAYPIEKKLSEVKKEIKSGARKMINSDKKKK